MELLRVTNEESLPSTVGFPSKHPGVPTKEHGWFLDTHKRVFAKVITPKTKIIFELGSWFGSSAKWFCANTDAKIFAIDIWDDSFILRDEHYVDSNSKANLWDHRDRLVPLRMKTVDGLRFLKEKGISPDVIYIDADHHYEPAKEDISTALKLFPDAVLVGDDYGNYEEVRRAVHECANKAGKTVHVDQNHCWTYLPIQSLTGVNIAPKMEEKKRGFKGMMSRYKKLRGVGNEKTSSSSSSVLPPATMSTTTSVVTVSLPGTEKSTNDDDEDDSSTAAGVSTNGGDEDMKHKERERERRSPEHATISDKKRKFTEDESE